MRAWARAMWGAALLLAGCAGPRVYETRDDHDHTVPSASALADDTADLADWEKVAASDLTGARLSACAAQLHRVADRCDPARPQHDSPPQPGTLGQRVALYEGMRAAARIAAQLAARQ